MTDLSESARASLIKRRREAKRAYAGNEPILEPMHFAPLPVAQLGQHGSPYPMNTPTDDAYQHGYICGHAAAERAWWSWRSFFIGTLTLAVLTALVLWKIA